MKWTLPSKPRRKLASGLICPVTSFHKDWQVIPFLWSQIGRRSGERAISRPFSNGPQPIKGATLNSDPIELSYQLSFDPSYQLQIDSVCI